MKNHVVKKTEDNAKIKNIEDKIPDITNVAIKATHNAKINEVKSEIPSITNLATEPSFYPYSIKVNDCSDSYNDIFNSYSKMRVPDAVKNINGKVFNLM